MPPGVSQFLPQHRASLAAQVRLESALSPSSPKLGLLFPYNLSTREAEWENHEFETRLHYTVKHGLKKTKNGNKINSHEKVFSSKLQMLSHSCNLSTF